MTYEIAEANVSDGTFIQRPMTDEEIAADEKSRKELAQKAEATKKAEAEFVSNRAALLEKLGITEDEAKLLIG